MSNAGNCRVLGRGVALATVLLLAILAPAVAAEEEIGLEAPAIVFSGGPLTLDVILPAGVDAIIRVEIDHREVLITALPDGTGSVAIPDPALTTGAHVVTITAGDLRAEATTRAIPAVWSVLPPLLAIGLAIAFKDVILSLFVGIYLGALILVGGHPLLAFARAIDRFVKPALADSDHAAIIIFSLLLGGMVGVISRSGGTLGVVNRLSGIATGLRRGQFAAWLMGMSVFFDDYANTLIVGPTMRPITDRLRISREKLAYIVDSTAAPIAAIVPISTWVGYEVGLIGESFGGLGLELNPYAVFIETIPYLFYPLFALLLVFVIAVTGRDFGPMLRAERRALETGDLIAAGDQALADYASDELAPEEGTMAKARNAVLPILTVIVVTILGLYLTGREAVAGRELEGADRFRGIISGADSYSALLWASLGGVVVAVVLGRFQAKLPLRKAMEGLVGGFKAMLLAIVVLVLAWSLGAVTKELHTADFIVSLAEGALSPHLLPALVFLAAAGVAFATGTSWATMAILIPLVVPVMHRLAESAGYGSGSEVHHTLLLGTISSVLAGSVWGDHCSPISDTTILSSMATGCDHIAHVRTQMPYALSLGILGLVVGDIPTAYGVSPWLSLLVGVSVIVAVVRWRGRPVRG